ncbi:MAG: zinc ribbon domain-containing protein [Thermoplasmatales archaeon]|nr:zinc ribbon domain-containing protein [Thermoplasmatales archaeon]
MSDEQVDDAVLKVYGIEKQKDGKGNTIQYGPKICVKCGVENPSIADYCSKCGAPLNKDKITEPGGNAKGNETANKEQSLIDNSGKELAKDFDPKFKEKILEDLLNEIVRNSQLKEKFLRALMDK